MKVAIGSDHAGFELKENVKKLLQEKGYEYEDLGPEKMDPQDDFNEYGEKVAKGVASKKYDRGILVCGTGMGMTILANKIPGIRAAACYDTNMARMSRLHNNANVLTLGGRITGKEQADDIITVWLETPFSDEERHNRRLKKLEKMEKTVTSNK